MVAAKETAEEQLLRMIEGPGGRPPPLGPLRRFSVDHLRDQIRAVIDALRRWVLPSRQGRDGSDVLLWRLRLAQRLFWMGLIGLAVFFVVDLFIFRPTPPLATRATSGMSLGSHAAPVTVEDQLLPTEEHRRKLLTRNPFGLIVSETGSSPVEQASKSRLAELAGPLTVVGINRGRIPEALIEDTTAQRTYVVKVGDQINGLMVKSIGQQGVVVSYEGEETLLP